ncbi:MAG: hypothetical protein AAGA18_13875 [Verrucomicrobiota bacterium]
MVELNNALSDAIVRACQEKQLPILQLRPYGEVASDLDLMFSAEPSYKLAIELLVKCSDPWELGQKQRRLFFQSMEVGERIVLLFQLLKMHGIHETDYQLQCKEPSCRESIEFPLSFHRLSEKQRRSAKEKTLRVENTEGGQSLSIRRPTGLDQAAWMNRGFVKLEQILKSLIVHVEGQEDDTWIFSKMDEISTKLEDFDPLVAYQVQTICPCCNYEAVYPVKLEAMALKKIKAFQSELLGSVHELASRYHWSEETILKMPSWRRHYYRQRIAKGNGL